MIQICHFFNRTEFIISKLEMAKNIHLQIYFFGAFFPTLHNPNVLVNRGDWLNKLWLLGVCLVGLSAHILSLCRPCPRFCVNQPFLQEKQNFSDVLKKNQFG